MTTPQTAVMPDLSSLRPGSPVKIAGKTGYWRFIDYVGENACEVVGPVRDEGGNSRIFKLTMLRKVPKNITEKDVAASGIVNNINHSAHTFRK